jgi:phage gp46-like protein
MPTIRVIEGDEPPATLFWDTQFKFNSLDPAFGMGDWMLADPDEEANNRGGLQATHPLETAVYLMLMSDAYRPDEMLDPGESEDRRGWHGDYFDMIPADGERELGSLLWTLERAQLTETTAMMARSYATQALQTLIDQRLIAQVEITYRLDKPQGRLTLDIQLIAPSGEIVLANSFPVR